MNYFFSPDRYTDPKAQGTIHKIKEVFRHLEDFPTVQQTMHTAFEDAKI